MGKKAPDITRLGEAPNGEASGGSLESGKKTAPGLYLVPTPLGNLEDASFRALEVLRSSSLIAAEDTRRSVKLLNRFGISAPLISYREENHRRAWPIIREALEKGGVVSLLSDAGSPLISDPGAALVRECREAGFPVRPLPGPSAAVTALLASGFDCSSFCFLGFPPVKASARRRFFGTLKEIPRPLVFFEAPQRILPMAEDLLEVLGDRRALLAREMTKIHEEYRFGGLKELRDDLLRNPRVGEITMVVEGNRNPGPIEGDELEGFVLSLGALKEILSLFSGSGVGTFRVKELAGEVSRILKLPSKIVYRLLTEVKEEKAEEEENEPEDVGA
ncbi:MAG: 16S rRNA (cytidine(1402)-2'-O)-methyltransferase [Deltaproteobacteria bacterium]|jgi:16S rRNA (cytidine1402-2'-O)-methyltransferase|nr:16S rRNA (cytidine(1402)-2'-O)-methyltransferase [Deltaproteobacteria bacterium]